MSENYVLKQFINLAARMRVVTYHWPKGEETHAFEESCHTEHLLKHRQAQHLHHHQIVRREEEAVTDPERPHRHHLYY